MKARIHYMIGEFEDSFVVSAPTVEEIRIKAYAGLESRNVQRYDENNWAEMLKEEESNAKS
jgi:hypothetical protein